MLDRGERQKSQASACSSARTPGLQGRDALLARACARAGATGAARAAAARAGRARRPSRSSRPPRAVPWPGTRGRRRRCRFRSSCSTPASKARRCGRPEALAPVLDDVQRLGHVAVVPQHGRQLRDALGVARLAVEESCRQTAFARLGPAALLLAARPARSRAGSGRTAGAVRATSAARGGGLGGIEAGQRAVERQHAARRGRRRPGRRRRDGPRGRPRARTARGGSSPRRGAAPRPVCGSALRLPAPRAAARGCRRASRPPGTPRAAPASTKSSGPAALVEQRVVHHDAAAPRPRDRGRALSFSQSLRRSSRPRASRKASGLWGKRSRALRRTQSAQGTSRTRVPTFGCSGISRFTAGRARAREDARAAEARDELGARRSRSRLRERRAYQRAARAHQPASWKRSRARS